QGQQGGQNQQMALASSPAPSAPQSRSQPRLAQNLANKKKDDGKLERKHSVDAANTKAPATAGDLAKLQKNIQADRDEETMTAVEVHFNPWTDASKDHLSTFGMDVDTASYAVSRGYLTDYHQMPSADLVRVEEFVNYFDYSYPAAKDKTFAIHLEGCPNPLNATTQLLRVGIRAKTIEAEERKAANLVFVIDESGSMQRDNRLPLVRASLHMLLEHLQPNDQVAIVVFSNTAETILPMTAVKDKKAIGDAIDKLCIAGATAIETGVRMAYDLAAKTYDKDKINRVIVCTDGEANVGITGPDAILQTITEQKEKGIYLSTVGFGLGDYNDRMLETLADKGNGNYSHIDSLAEARRVFVEKLTGTLQTVAKDAKIQVDFNPNEVAEYRLIGYEDRDIADRDFRNDKIDGGEVGAGQSVTVLYEIKRKAGAPGADSQETQAIATVQIRFKDPNTPAGAETVHEESHALTSDHVAAGIDATSLDMRLAVAVAEFADALRKNPDLPAGALAQAKTLANAVVAARGYDDKLKELVKLIESAEALQAAERTDATPVAVK
ncbi:MAG TPA: von Willebrand factor type A domain-containing protein, partial [Planctomycetota bacterium]|nr:von Willebrand factor type A domain-containing protein [Planctomycetota bacterium]